MVNGYILMGSISNSFIVFSILNVSLLFNFYEQILSLKSRLFFGKLLLLREGNQKSQKLSPFVKIVKKHWGVASIWIP